MIIPVTNIEQEGAGVELSEQPEGMLLEMSDPVQDIAYARNAVTLTYDLAGFSNLRLTFAAREYGDEPHTPPPGPFGNDVDFDGVAVSADGEQWYEVQSLRELRSDKFTTFDIDFDATIAALGLAYGAGFKIRFCQYDDNPAPMDGFSIQKVKLSGDPPPPVLHLAMDDNDATAVVADSAASGYDQTFLDPGGDPNTSSHTAAGVVGTALSFDGIDDRIVLTGESYRECLAENHDFAITFWWKTNAPDPALTLHFLNNRKDTENSLYAYTQDGDVKVLFRFAVGEPRWIPEIWTDGADDQWHHYILMRKGTVISIYRDGLLGNSDDNPENALSLAPSDVNLTIGSTPGGNSASPGYVDDFRVYDRALFDAEIAELANPV